MSKLGREYRKGLRLNTKAPQRFRDKKNDYKRRPKNKREREEFYYER